MNFLLLLPGAFFAPVIHEWVKARVSAAMGDAAPKHNGFITWNPLKFFEPIGFFMLMYFQVGWGRPVTTSPFYYKDKRKGIALTYAAPIVANLLVGMVAIVLISRLSPVLLFQWALPRYQDGATWTIPAAQSFLQAIEYFGRLNINLAVFNLIPIFPMSMNKLIQVFISPESSMKLNHYEKPLQIILFLLLFFNVLQPMITSISQIFINMVAV